MEKKSDALDAADRVILRLLQQNAYLTTKEIAAQLDLTTTPVHERIKRLEREGYIERYTAVVSRRKVGLPLLVFCDVALKEHNREYLLRFERFVGQFDEVLECYHVTGQYDYTLKVVVADMDAYQRFIKEKLATLENIGRVQSHFVMTEVKSTTALPM
jgi:Lrp/AsnC family leucine-responsive transcriptional regulator